MKEKIKKTICPISVFAICLAVAFPFFFFGCGVQLSYSGSNLMAGRVGEEYISYVGTASGAETVTYALAEGSMLPAGLSMDADGFIEGTPTAKGDFTFSVVAAAEGSTATATFTVSIAEGALSYAGGDVKVAHGVAFERSIATAVTSSGSYMEGVTYSLADDSAALPEGVTLTGTGILAGTVPENGEYTIRVTASAQDCAGATADVRISVVNAWLDYEAASLRRGTAGEYYTGSVASAVNGTGSDASPNINYRIADGSKLPAGLEMTTAGVLYGIPETVGTSIFSVTAYTAGYAAATAEFELKINPSLPNEITDGKITMRTETLENIESGTNVFLYGAVLATASNRQTVTYSITEGNLPSGITLYPDGTLAGRTIRTGNFEIVVTASAAGCEPVSRTFTLSVLVTLIYDNMTLYTDPANDLYVGEDCSLDIATASFPSGYGDSDVPITYEARTALPEGLSLSPEGVITGVPVKSAKMVQITVVASAEGFTSKAAIVSIHIEDAVVSGVTRFEAEYTDLRGKTGAGYSGSAQEEGLINSNVSVIASMSKDGKTSECKAGGYYIPYTYGAITFEFKFESDRTVTGASLALYLDSEVVTPAGSYEIRVNGTPVSYGGTSISNQSGSLIEFLRYDIGSVNLKAGLNTITISNTSGAYVPAFDAMELGNLGGATLSWRPSLYNLPGYAQV